MKVSALLIDKSEVHHHERIEKFMNESLNSLYHRSLFTGPIHDFLIFVKSKFWVKNLKSGPPLISSFCALRKGNASFFMIFPFLNYRYLLDISSH